MNSVLIVDDEDLNIMVLTHILNPEYTIYAAKGGKKALELAEKHRPDVILLDIMMPGMDGFSVLAALKDSINTHEIPVIFITGLSNADDEERGLASGGADYITKPFTAATVKLRVMNQIKIINQIRTIERLSMKDSLTSIPNRRGFDIRMELEWNRAVRDKTPLGVMLMDVDRFKAYNDTYGHQQGDEALKAVAGAITKTLNRASDFAARWGGEEFIVLLPNTDLTGSINIAKRIRMNVSNLEIIALNGTRTGITVSIGVNARIPSPADTVNGVISLADKALYIAKESGRNMVSSIP